MKQRESGSAINLPFGVCLFCVVVAETYLFGYYINKYSGGSADMDGTQIGAIVAIVVAIIGLVGGIWMQVVQFKKDGQRIDSVNDTAKKVSEDTAHMRPEIDTMAADVKYLHDSALANEHDNQSVQNGVKELLEAKHINDALREAAKSNIPTVDRMQSYIEILYISNSEKDSKIIELNHKLLVLEQEKETLAADIKAQKKVIKSLTEQLQEKDTTIDDLKNEIQSLSEKKAELEDIGPGIN